MKVLKKEMSKNKPKRPFHPESWGGRGLSYFLRIDNKTISTFEISINSSISKVEAATRAFAYVWWDDLFEYDYINDELKNRYDSRDSEDLDPYIWEELAN